MMSKLKYEILRAGLTNRKVAERCGFPRERISDYIHGTRTIPPRHLLLLCDVLRCNPDDIMGSRSFDDSYDISVKID